MAAENCDTIYRREIKKKFKVSPRTGHKDPGEGVDI
jgi:hypothetical protein